MKTYTRAQCIAFERAHVQERGTPWAVWQAARLRALFDAHGGSRGAGASQITPETVRHGEAL